MVIIPCLFFFHSFVNKIGHVNPYFLVIQVFIDQSTRIGLRGILRLLLLTIEFVLISAIVWRLRVLVIELLVKLLAAAPIVLMGSVIDLFLGVITFLFCRAVVDIVIALDLLEIYLRIQLILKVLVYFAILILSLPSLNMV